MDQNDRNKLISDLLPACQLYIIHKERFAFGDCREMATGVIKRINVTIKDE